MNLSAVLKQRYSTKSFDPQRKISPELWAQIEEGLRLSASSTNAQPWHFIIASTDEGKERLTRGTREKYQFNTDKILRASHVVLFCTKIEIDDAYLRHVLEVEESDGRYANEEFREMMHAGRQMFVGLHKDELNDLKHWNEKQVYLNVGGALLGAGVLGVDSLPMEGIDIETLDSEFGLKEKGFTSSVMVAFGYHTEDDFNSKLPKSRLRETEIFTKI